MSTSQMDYLVDTQPEGFVVKLFGEVGVRCIHKVGFEPSK